MPPAIPIQFHNAVELLAPSLRSLLDDELAAGNRIKRVIHEPPALDGGVCVMLVKPITTRPRETSEGLTFWKESSSEYSCSFTDSAGRDFILEAPLEKDGAYPDMDAIREEANHPYPLPVPPKPDPKNQTIVERFRSAMVIDWEMWHDGAGYKLDMLAEATDDDKAQMVQMLTPPTDWRDIDALVALKTDAARAALQVAVSSHNIEVRAAALSYLPSAISDDERIQMILQGLKEGEFYGSLTGVLDQVEAFHPPEIINALFRGLFEREGEVATHFAAMLAFLHDKADSAFDWELRPLFLKFNTTIHAERVSAFNELCALLELDSTQAMARIAE